MLSVRPRAPDDGPWQAEALGRAWHSTAIARLGELVDLLAVDALVAVRGGERCGLLTYAVRHDEVEILTIQVDTESLGTGRALMDAARDVADKANARRLWLITTNDNLRAIRFYQRWGMRLAVCHRDGVARSRQVKPSIPLLDPGGVPIRDELEFELLLRP